MTVVSIIIVVDTVIATIAKSLLVVFKEIILFVRNGIRNRETQQDERKLR